MNKEILLLNIDKVHTTKMGIDRIKKNESIRYWAKGELEILLRKCRKTAIRYFGI